MEGFTQKMGKVLETEPLKRLGLRFVGAGSDRVVFETAGSDRKRIKVSADVLKQKIVAILYGVSEDRNTGEAHQKAEIAEQKRYEDQIAEVFGSEHLLQRGVFRAKIPLTKGILSQFLGEQEEALVERLDEDVVYEVDMLAETQLVAPELQDPETFKTQSFNTNLIRADEFYGAETIDDALSRVRAVVDEKFLATCDEWLKDERYRAVVREIVEKIIAYSKQTGLMIDIFGGDNITIFDHGDGSLGYHLLDVVLPGSQQAREKNISEDGQLTLLRHYYTFYYSIHQVAEKMGLSNNLELHDLVYFKGADIPTGAFPR